MNWIDMIGCTIAAAAALECIVGRIAPLDRRIHRPSVLAGYVGAACVCILSASLTWQGYSTGMLELLALGIAGHLMLSWEDWRHGPPSSVRRDAPHYPPGAVPSRIDGGDNAA